MNWSLLNFGIGWALLTAVVWLLIAGYECLLGERYAEGRELVTIVRKALFRSQFGLAGLALFICVYWFFTGKSLLTCGLFQNVIERGTFAALSSVMGIVGIGSLFLGWIFSERDKCTMGKSQIEMIHLCYGRGYGLSIVVHFVFTAVTLVMVNCKAREPALISFLTLAWGCVPQVLICMRIGMNKSMRRKLALKLWAKDGENAENLLSTFRAMAANLNETQIRYDMGYIMILSGIIQKEISHRISNNNEALYITSQNIISTSIMLRDLFEIIPAQEREYFEAILLKNICDQLDTSANNNRMYEDSQNQERFARNNLTMITLCHGYIRYVYLYYSPSHQTLSNRVKLITNFSDSRSSRFTSLLNLMSDTENALKWLLFLAREGDIPTETRRKGTNCKLYKTSFRLLVQCTLIDGNFAKRQCDIAWEQLYS